LNRLTGASGPTAYSYGYDANGNLTNDNGVTQSFNAANELTQAGPTTYSFDANGNETGNSAGLTLSYNPKNQTTAIGSLSMAYTGATQTERVTAGSTNFTYNVLGCGGSSTGVASNTSFTRDNKGQLVEERLPGTPNYVPYYYLFDGLGSVVGLTDSTGNVVNTYSYQPYGKLASSTGSVANPWLFAGGYLDSSNGLYKFGMRYYDPSAARWTQEDSEAGPNLYAYVNGNPINYVDPTGAGILGDCLKWGIGAAITSGIAGVVGAEAVAIFTTGGLASLPAVVAGGVGGAVGGFLVGCGSVVIVDLMTQWGWFNF
jgi:RHS repeat-associated protein